MGRFSLAPLFCRARLVAAGSAVLLASLSFSPNASASSFEIWSPDWSITLTDHGYSDLLFDQRPGFEGREYLSGEWGAAVDYTKGGNARSGPTWLEPFFVFPDWSTNSDFDVIESISGTTFDSELSHYTAAVSKIGNGDLEITMTYEFVDTTTGIAQGTTPVSGGHGSFLTSNRYVLKQTYEIKNVSGEEITDLQLYQFLHGLESAKATVDNRLYTSPEAPTAFDSYRYDITQQGTSIGYNYLEGGYYEHDDIIAFHASLAPSAWEVGFYGREDVDGHGVGKPSVGVHLSVEADSLSGTDFFDPSEVERWVSGAQRFDLISLGIGDSTTFDVLLSISTQSVEIPDPYGPAVPEPSSAVLLGLGAGVLLLATRRRRQ